MHSWYNNKSCSSRQHDILAHMTNQLRSSQGPNIWFHNNQCSGSSHAFPFFSRTTTINHHKKCFHGFLIDMRQWQILACLLKHFHSYSQMLCSSRYTSIISPTRAINEWAISSAKIIFKFYYIIIIFILTQFFGTFQTALCLLKMWDGGALLLPTTPPSLETQGYFLPTHQNL